MASGPLRGSRARATVPAEVTAASSAPRTSVLTAALCLGSLALGFFLATSSNASREPSWPQSPVSGPAAAAPPAAAPPAQMAAPSVAVAPVLSAARDLLDAARSSAGAVIPAAVTAALEKLGMASFASEAKAAPLIPVSFPITKSTAYLSSANNEAGFWALLSSGAWESATFRVYNGVLKARPGVVIDFGSWIGPTVITAAQAASTRVYGMEIDPVAFTQLALNVAANPTLAAKTNVFFMGISDEMAAREFSSGACTSGMGDSCSSMTAASLNPAQKWTVQTMPLELFVEAQGIKLEEISLIKIDTEGAELFIVPPLVAWMAKWPGGKKPVIWLSLHGKFIGNEKPWQAKVEAFMKLYAYGYRESNGALVLQWDTRETAKGPNEICSDGCTYMLSDSLFAI
jgi:FkbM family methyltransferase